MGIDGVPTPKRIFKEFSGDGDRDPNVRDDNLSNNYSVVSPTVMAVTITIILKKIKSKMASREQKLWN